MIIIFSAAAGISITEYKKAQLDYIDDLIFLGERIILLLGSTVPDTQTLYRKLGEEPRLEKYAQKCDISEIYTASPLPERENGQTKELLSVVGRYDAQTQIEYAREFTGYYKDLKKQYREHYRTHAKLYIAVSISVGAVTALLLI